MEKENKSIHEFDINLICEYFLGIERQGPGSEEATLTALGFIEGLNENSVIADLGCGTGSQTMVLARHAPGNITGIDLFAAFIDKLNADAAALNLSHRVKGIVGSMNQLPFNHNELDLIWAEGAIYNIGFVKGLTEWRKFLKPGGYIAVTEASWFTNQRPHEIEEFWMNAYPEIDTIPNKVLQMQNAGFIPEAAFILKEDCWKANYYDKQVARQTEFLEKFRENKTIIDFIDNQRLEAQLYDKYKAYYGYVFYIGRKM